MKKTIKFKVGDKVIALKHGLNNTEISKGSEYTVSQVDKEDGMIKLAGHPDWWSPERFEKQKN